MKYIALVATLPSGLKRTYRDKLFALSCMLEYVPRQTGRIVRSNPLYSKHGRTWKVRPKMSTNTR